MTNNPSQPTGTPVKSSPSKQPKDVAPKGELPARPLSSAEKKLIQDLAGQYAGIGFLVTGFDAYTGVMLIKEAEKRATELVNVARHHKKMMEFLKRLAAGNDYMTCILGHGIMLYAIASHFGRVPQTPILAAMGLSEEQILAPPPGMAEMMNGHAPDLAYAGS